MHAGSIGRETFSCGDPIDLLKMRRSAVFRPIHGEISASFLGFCEEIVFPSQGSVRSFEKDISGNLGKILKSWKEN